MPNRLLDRQIRLIAHLTSPPAIFGESATAPEGIDAGLLHIEARMSHEKRIGKIATVLPRTFARLGKRRRAVLRDFAAACPPASIGRISNARQFQEFLAGRLGLEPAWLTELARAELAFAELREAAPHENADRAATMVRMVRRSPGIVLVRCAFDIWPILAGRSVTPVRRDTPLVIARDHHSNDPMAAEVPLQLFEFLAALSDWTALDEFAPSGDANALVRDLVASGLIEVRA
ncbi:MAG TPA: hypothetical protein VN823_00050 [Stellaceae bacterium]|nr:hypothetical protein [Stellaceae bacterium]